MACYEHGAVSAFSDYASKIAVGTNFAGTSAGYTKTEKADEDFRDKPPIFTAYNQNNNQTEGGFYT